MIRLSTTAGTRLESAQSLNVTIGGAESNVAAALARLGRKVAWSSVLPRNIFGQRIVAELTRHGVDTRHVHWVDRGRVGVYYLDTGAPPRPTHVLYDRAGSAMAIAEPEQVSTDLVSQGTFLHLTGITPALSPNCAEIARKFAQQAVDADVPLSFDVNYRAALWPPAMAAEMLEPFCVASTVLFCGRHDAELIWGLSGSDDDLLRALSNRFGAATTVLTLGEQGAMAMTQDGQILRQPAIPATAIDRVGAGDAFAAGFLHGYLDGDIELGLRRGVALAALKLTIEGDIAVISAGELDDWTSTSTRPIIR